MGKRFTTGGGRSARVIGLSVPVLALLVASAGTASAAEAQACTPVMDGLTSHWQKYHQGKDPAEELGQALADPNGYLAIHQEMAMQMLCQGQ